MSRYLVAGIAGFIGSALARALLDGGHEVVGVDNLSTGLREQVPDGARFIQADVADERLYAQELSGEGGFDALFHTAGLGRDATTRDDPSATLRANTQSTIMLAQYALRTGCMRFIHASSVAVYGPLPRESFSMPGDGFSEETPTNPVTPFGISKFAAERYLAMFAEQGLQYTSLRLFRVYGPGRDDAHPNASLINVLLAMMVRDGHIHVRGNPNRFRDFVYIDDVVQAFLCCLTHPRSYGRAINIGSTDKVAIGDLVEIMRTLPGTPVTVEYSGGTGDEQFGVHADAVSAAKYLGYEGEVSLAEGLRRTYEWHVARIASH